MLTVLLGEMMRKREILGKGRLTVWVFEEFMQSAVFFRGPWCHLSYSYHYFVAWQK